MKNMPTTQLLLLCLIALGHLNIGRGQESKDTIVEWTKKDLLFEDKGTKNWTQKWFLDGEEARVDNVPLGMYLAAGPKPGNDTSHTVLWTQQRFEGNILIEYDYTRVDTVSRYVNILYFHATGKGGKEYPEDISLWNDKRKVPTMSIYFRNMNAYHISYAVGGANDYIRLRRYQPDLKKLRGSDILPDNFNTGLFKPFFTYHIRVIRLGNQIEMQIQNKSDASDQLICRWDASKVEACNEGRIGLRHMYTRSAIYKDFKVWRITKK
ncbi:MAG: DUF1961 family protein [Bacteroidota bacterium]